MLYRGDMEHQERGCLAPERENWFEFTDMLETSSFIRAVLAKSLLPLAHELLNEIKVPWCFLDVMIISRTREMFEDLPATPS